MQRRFLVTLVSNFRAHGSEASKCCKWYGLEPQEKCGHHHVRNCFYSPNPGSLRYASFIAVILAQYPLNT